MASKKDLPAKKTVKGGRIIPIIAVRWTVARPGAPGLRGGGSSSSSPARHRPARYFQFCFTSAHSARSVST